MVPVGPKRTRKQQRRRRQRRRRQDTPKALHGERSHGHSASLDASLSSMGISPRVDGELPGDTAKRGFHSDNSGDNLGCGLVPGSEERCEIATEEYLGPTLAVSPLPLHAPERGDVQDGAESIGGHTAVGGRTTSVKIDSAEPRFLASSRVHPQPNGTRVIAVQTDSVPAKDQGTDAAEYVWQTPDSQMTAFPPILYQRRYTDGARLHRRLTGPGDLTSNAVDDQHFPPSTWAADTFVGGERPNSWRNLHVMDPSLSPKLLNERTEEGRPATSGAGSGSSIVGPVRRRENGVEELSTAHARKLVGLLLSSADQTGRPGTSETESTAAQQEEMLEGSRSKSDLVAKEELGVENANQPLASESKVDDVTWQLQQLLREDALQDDGG